MNGLLAVSAAAAIALASPSTGGPVLGTLLAPPPSFDWVQGLPSSTRIEGAFTAHDYGAYSHAIDPNASASDIEAGLASSGFTGGYGGEWEQRTTQDYLVERVFAFNDDSGANNWYGDVKLNSQTSSAYVRDIPGVSAIPNSFGVVLKAKGSTGTQWRVDFLEGNLVFVVHTDSTASDLSALAVSQAQKEYEGALNGPSSPSPGRGGSGAASVHAPLNLLTGLLVSVGALMLLAIAIGLVFLLTRAGRRPPLAPVGYGPVQMSPDRAYWWDGVQWRPADTSTPPTAPRSPDGLHWWDGAAWRPVR